MLDTYVNVCTREGVCSHLFKKSFKVFTSFTVVVSVVFFFLLLDRNAILYSFFT